MTTTAHTPIVSVIVPVYNNEKYLSHCINSILNQSCQDFEIILVDDGSQDNSLNICTEFANADARIKVLHQKNYGVSAARNNALHIAEGKYITFIDGDDYVEKKYLENLLDAIGKDNVQLGICGFREIYSETKTIKLQTMKSCYLSNSCLYKELFLTNNIRGYLWNKIFLRSIILNNNIYLNEQLTIREDQDFIFRYLKYTENGFFVDNCAYNYIRHFGSATRPDINSEVYMQKRVDMYLEILKALNSMQKNLSDTESQINSMLLAEKENAIKGLLLECMYEKILPDSYNVYIEELRRNLLLFLKADGYSVQQKIYALAISLSWNCTRQIRILSHYLKSMNKDENTNKKN